MRLPKKIQFVDSFRSGDTMLRFENWEGYDQRKQIKNMAQKINQILDYLEALPQIPNELPPVLEQEGTTLSHVHEWITHLKMGGREFFECEVCGETMIKATPARA